MSAPKRTVIIGGGAAGIFAAALLSEKQANMEIIVLEKTRQLLSKVRISGGGRCNVTHSEFDPKVLTKNYPRGEKELLGPFHTFQPRDTIAWFSHHGVKLKTEEDGRMFPITDNSATIINCLLDVAKQGGVLIKTEHAVRSIEKTPNGFNIFFEKQEPLSCDAIILATGSTPQGHKLATALGHSIVNPVPSLFTFNVPSSQLLDLAGITMQDAELSLKSYSQKQRGPLLLTHWGFSGPAALKLSAFGARDLQTCDYRTELTINWVPNFDPKEIYEALLKAKKNKPHKMPENENIFQLPSQLWKRFVNLAVKAPDQPIGHLSNQKLEALSQFLSNSRFQVEGKTTYKSEFVTAGGIQLKEINFRTMESKLVPHLFFAGEILDIDGITGGFNFQNAWTTAYLATQEIATY